MIKELYKTNREIALNLVKDEQLNVEDIEELYELLREEDNELLFAIYNFFNKNPDYLDFEKFSTITNLPAFVLHKIFIERPIKAKFPVVNNHQAQIATAYIFKFDKEIPKNSFLEKYELSKIKKLLKTKGISKDFFVIFDKNFKGKSYLLAVASGLVLPEYTLDGFLFTGEVNEEGEIYPVGFIEKKEMLAKKHNLKLITYGDVYHIDELIYYLGDIPIDIPFLHLSNKPLEEAYISLEKLENKIKEKIKFYSLDKIEKFFELKKEDLILTTEYLSKPDKDENHWIETIKEFEEKLKKIYTKIPRKKRILHFAGSISSLAFGFGIKLGAKKPVVVYHYQADDYYEVIDLSDENEIRKIKHIKDKLEILEIKNLNENKNAKEIAIALWIASHNPYGDVLRFSEDKNWKVIGIEAKEFKGNLPLPKNFSNKDLWIEVVRELYTVLNNLKSEKYEKFHLFLSSPVAISFALGMAVGHFINGSVYNISKDKDIPYFKIFDIEDKNLHSLF